jgi:hypothetical protein
VRFSLLSRWWQRRRIYVAFSFASINYPNSPLTLFFLYYRLTLRFTRIISGLTHDFVHRSAESRLQEYYVLSASPTSSRGIRLCLWASRCFSTQKHVYRRVVCEITVVSSLKSDTCLSHTLTPARSAVG